MKALIQLVIITVCIYFTLYLVCSFIIFKFVNPFAWVLEVPNYLPYRIIILVSLVFLGAIWKHLDETP